MRTRCPGARPGFRARLADHRLDFTHWSQRWQGGTADIVPEAGAIVFGLVYEMGADDFARLDPFESGYRRVAVSVLADDGAAHAVESYTVLRKGRFAPHPRYLAQIVAGAERLAFPSDYLEALRGLARIGG